MCTNRISFGIIFVYFIVSWYLCSIIIGLLNQYAVILLPSCQIFYQLISILECNLNMTYILNWLNLTVMVTIKTNQSPLQSLVIHRIQFYVKATRKITLNLQNVPPLRMLNFSVWMRVERPSILYVPKVISAFSNYSQVYRRYILVKRR